MTADPNVALCRAPERRVAARDLLRDETERPMAKPWQFR
jgi:hypothetical protein